MGVDQFHHSGDLPCQRIEPFRINRKEKAIRVLTLFHSLNTNLSLEEHSKLSNARMAIGHCLMLFLVINQLDMRLNRPCNVIHRSVSRVRVAVCGQADGRVRRRWL